MKSGMVLLLLVFGLMACTSESHPSGGDQNPYAVDPMTLPAYKLYIEPAVNRIAGLEDPASKNNPYFTSLRWQNFLKHKLWRLGPLDTPAISKDILGVSFSSDQTQQLAVQTANEIWIRSDFYNAMNIRDQANLLIHEFVMSIYFLKYKSFTEFCRIANARGASREDCSVYDFLDKQYPSRPPKPLTATDYQNIRRVTSFFIQQGGSASLDEIQKVLTENQFDPRIFSKEMDSGQNRPEFIDGAQLAEIFTSARVRNKMPDKCSFYGLNIEESCVLDTQASSHDFSLKISSGNGSGGDTYFDHAFDSPLAYIVPEKNSFTQEVFYLYYVGRIGVDKNSVVGSRARFNSLIFTASDYAGGAKYQFNGFISQSMVMKEEKIISGRRMCFYENIQPSKRQDDTLIVLFDTKDLPYLKMKQSTWAKAATCD